MKYSNKFALAGLLFVNTSIFAATPAEGLYAGFIAGLSYSPNVSFYVTDPFTGTGITSLGTLNHKIGGDGGAQIGYRICNFRLEGELMLNVAPFSQLTLAGTTIKRHVTPIIPIRMGGQTVFGAGFFNAYFDIYDEENDPTFVPYVGLGVGYSYLRTNLRLTIPYVYVNSVSSSLRDSETTPMGQIILGTSYYFSDVASLGMDYRYMTTKSINFFNTRLQAHTLNFVFNYSFDN